MLQKYPIRDYLNFNPRSHEGSDIKPCSISRFFLISIHAPTRGATAASVSSFSPVCNFNPRSHEGSDKAKKLLVR